MCSGLEIDQTRHFHKSFAFASYPRDARRSRATESSASQRSHLFVLVPLSLVAALAFPRLDPFQTLPPPSHPSSCRLDPSNRVTKHQPTPLIRAASKSRCSKSRSSRAGPCKSSPWSGLLPAIDRFHTVLRHFRSPFGFVFSFFCLKFT